MYIIRNALKCIGRSKGRNILIGIIVLVIAVSACIGLSIRQAAQSAKEETLSGMTVTATISIDRQAMMGNMGGFDGGGFDKRGFADKMTATESLTLSDYQKYAQADSVQDFYYTVTASLNGTDEFEAVTSDQEETAAGSTSNGMTGLRGGMGGFSDGTEKTNRGGFEKIENMFGKNAANYVSEINSAMNFTVVLQMLGIAVLLTLVAGAVSMLFVMRYEPLKILANRD